MKLAFLGLAILLFALDFFLGLANRQPPAPRLISLGLASLSISMWPGLP